MTVDWTKPLVAVDTKTGERVEVELVGGADSVGDYTTAPPVFDACCFFWHGDGKNWSSPDRYHIENRDQEPPVWALKEACERAGVRYNNFADGYFMETSRNSIRAHALTIAKHEDEPEDPDLVKAREYAAQAFEGVNLNNAAADAREGVRDETITVQAALLAIKGERA